MIVVDGGSLDATAELARESGGRVMTTGRGRGMQLHAGAKAARGELLWFLHADTRPSAEVLAQLTAARGDPAVTGGNFRLRFSGDTRPARFMTWFYAHIGRFGLCYGDSAIFIRRTTYEAIGGFRALPLFEDLDLVSRLLATGGFRRLNAEVVTSSRRFEKRCFASTFLQWICLQVLWWLGVPPGFLVRLYDPVRDGAGNERAHGPSPVGSR